MGWTKKLTYLLFGWLSVCLVVKSQAQESRIKKEPYLLYSGINTEMTVLWQLDSTLECTLEWGLNIQNLTGLATTIESGPGNWEHQHAYTITGLAPGEHYFYRITENGVNHKGSFRTAPDSNAETICFFAYGDTRTHPERTDSISERINEEIAADSSLQTIIIHTGDWNIGDYESFWQDEFFNRSYLNNSLLHATLPINGTRGNHEEDCSEYDKYWPYPYETGGHYYSIDYGPVHFVFIDQYVDYSVTSAQYSWLLNDLQTTDKAHKILVYHEPAYSDGVHANNTQAQSVIQPLCEAYDIKLILNGHNHYYAHCLINNVHHLTVGGGGAPTYIPTNTGEGLVYSEPVLQYAKISINLDTVCITVIDNNGITIEEFCISQTPTSALSNTTKNIQLSVFPNKNELYIEIKNIKDKPATIEVFNAEGKLITTKSYDNNKSTIIDKISITGTDSGVYLIRASTGNITQTKKIFIH